MKIISLALIILTCVSNWSFSQTDTTITKEQWTKDLIFLEQTIQRKHKNLYHRVSKEDLSSSFTSLKDKFDSLSSKEKLIELIMIMSQIGDGHSNIRSYDIFNYLPIHVKWFEEDLHIIWAKSSLSDILGYKILSIDGNDISTVKELVNKLSPKGENKYLLMQWGQQWIRNIDVLEHLGLAKSKTHVDLILEDQNGVIVKKSITAIVKEELKEMKWKSAFDPLPLYMQHGNHSLKHEILGNVLYLNFRSYPSKKEMVSYSKELVNILSDRQALTKLIIDFRVNGGGDFKVGRLLIDRLKESNLLYNRKTYVITGRRTFSAAMVNALDFREQLDALILGEPPMQRPNGYSESHLFMLPNSKINASVSSEYYTFQDDYRTVEQKICTVYMCSMGDINT